MRRYKSIVGIAIALLSFGGPAIAKTTAPPITVSVNHVEGRDAIHIAGKGPASTAIRLYSEVAISRDLPRIPLGDRDGFQTVVSDETGNFETEVSLAGTQWQTSIINVVADIPNTRIHANTSLILGKTSPGVDHKQADVLPTK